jgi:hypothetical protein
VAVPSACSGEAVRHAVVAIAARSAEEMREPPSNIMPVLSVRPKGPTVNSQGR